MFVKMIKDEIKSRAEHASRLFKKRERKRRKRKAAAGNNMSPLWLHVLQS